MRSTSRLIKAFISLTLLILLGCEPTPQTSNPLDDTKWILQSVYGRPPQDSTIITLEFSKGYVHGNSGCNDYFSGNMYQVSEDGHLILPRFAMSMALCSPKEIMDQEEAYTKALDNVVRYRLTEGRLELQGKTGDTILVFTNRNLVTLPYLVGAIITGGIIIFLLWFLWKNRPIQNYS